MLYIIRHGKTEWNAIHHLQGWTDIPLNEEGRAQAAKAGTECADVHFDVCYCSPLQRARETAALLLQGRDVPILQDERLKEMGFGKYEGALDWIADPSCPVKKLAEDPAHYDPDGGGETLEELFARTGSFLKEVIEPGLAQGQDILIVGHGAMNSAIICQVNGSPIEDLWKVGIQNCRLIRLK